MANNWINLNNEEVAERAKLLAEKISEHDSLVLERKASAQKYKEQIDALNREIRDLSHAVRFKQELKKITLWDDQIQ